MQVTTIRKTLSVIHQTLSRKEETEHWCKETEMALFNLAWYPAFFWDGRASLMRSKFFIPLENTTKWILTGKLQQNDLKTISTKKQFKEIFGTSKVDSTHISYAIAQFLRTLIPINQNMTKWWRKALFNKDEYEGFNLVNDQTKGDCIIATLQTEML